MRMKISEAAVASGCHLETIRYYEKLEQRSSDWTNSLFEASWAYFMKTNNPKALGNIDVGGEPTTAVFIGGMNLAGVNTSESFTAPSGKVNVSSCH